MPPPSTLTHTTTFLVADIHCPSCISNILAASEALLTPSPILLSNSIIHHTLTFQHAQPAQDIADLLEDQGYEVDSIVYDATDATATPTKEHIRHNDHRTSVNDTRIARHRENCEQCRLEAQSSHDHDDDDTSTETIKKPEFVVSETPGRQGQYRFTLAVSGMTCASCVGTITKALNATPWVHDNNVNLLSGAASVVVDGAGRDADLVEIIEDLGYDAKVDSVVEVQAAVSSSKGASAKSPSEDDKAKTRTVDILINGLYCHHCPPRTQAVLAKYEKRGLRILNLPTLEQPILRISYPPSGPDFTIRAILATLADADDAFNPTLYHAPTVEERARLMQRKEQRRLLYRLILSGIIAIPTFVIGIVYMNLVAAGDPGKMFLMSPLHNVSRAEWAMFVLATPVYFGCADIFHRRAIKELRVLWASRSKVPLLRRFYRFGSMSMLLSFGTTIAYFSSIAEMAIAATTRDEHGMDYSSYSYFDSVVFLTFFLLIGRLIEAYSKSKSGDAVAALGKLRPTEATLIGEGGDTKISTDLLDLGDIVRVTHGASPPCDGLLVSGEASFDESSLTGESRPVSKSAGDTLYSGTINLGQASTMEVTGSAGQSMLDQIISAVRDGQTKRAPVERIVDSLTAYFVPVITLIAIVTWVTWLALGLSGTLPQDWKQANSPGGWPFWSLQFAIAVFVIACPCGIGLAAPTALFVGGGLAAKYGILVKGGGEAFQEASMLDCVVFDKTGTVTLGGQPKVIDFETYGEEIKRSELMGLMLAVENSSSHPIASAISEYCKSNGAAAASMGDIREVPGKGMFGLQTANEGDRQILIGNERLMGDHEVTISRQQSSQLQAWSEQAKTVVLIASKGSHKSVFRLSAMLSISDPIRPEAAGIISTLNSMGIVTYLLTGDNATTAAAVGASLAISPAHIIAGVLPTEKAAKIRSLQSTLTPSRGRARASVAMIGDGINDAPALATADVGIAIGSGADVALSAAHFVLIRPDIKALPLLLRLSRTVFTRVKLNFAWALVYNLVALPVAAGVLYPIRPNGGSHVRLDPAWAALAMALSSVSVVLSSLALRSGVPGLGFRVRKTE